MSWIRAFRVCAFAMVVASGSASSATIGINGSILTVFATEGDDVLLVAPSSPTSLSFIGLLLSVVTPGCVDVGPIDCSIAGLTEIRINMLGGDDVVQLSGVPAIPSLTFIVLGGDGDDILLGGGSSQQMFGGAGDDILLAGTGLSCLSGGTGDNVLIGSQCDPGVEPVFPPARPGSVPEPAAWLMLVTAGALLAAMRRPWRGRRLSNCARNVTSRSA